RHASTAVLGGESAPPRPPGIVVADVLPPIAHPWIHASSSRRGHRTQRGYDWRGQPAARGRVSLSAGDAPVKRALRIRRLGRAEPFLVPNRKLTSAENIVMRQAARGASLPADGATTRHRSSPSPNSACKAACPSWVTRTARLWRTRTSH